MMQESLAQEMRITEPMALNAERMFSGYLTTHVTERSFQNVEGKCGDNNNHLASSASLHLTPQRSKLLSKVFEFPELLVEDVTDESIKMKDILCKWGEAFFKYASRVPPSQILGGLPLIYSGFWRTVSMSFRSFVFWVRRLVALFIQGATRIPPSGCGIASGYGSCICHRCDFIFVFCGLFGVLCNVPAD